MYKLVDTTTHEIWLGTEKAVIRFANDKLKDKEWISLYFGFIRGADGRVEEIKNIELATKYLQKIEDIEVIDIGDILEALKNNEMILLSQED